jgi:hypothetical protein
VVVDVDPVADVEAVAVELRAPAVEHVRDLARDELLDVLVGAVVVRAVADGGGDPERAHPRAHQEVAAGLGGGVRAARVVRRGLGEALRVVQLEVPVDLVGRDVVQPDRAVLTVPADRLEDREGADDVGLHEGRGVGQRVVVVRLGGEVHDQVVLGHQAVDEHGVGDAALHQRGRVAE